MVIQMKRPDMNDKVAAQGGTSSQPPVRTAGLGFVRRLAWSLPLGWQLSALYAALLVLTLSLVGWLVYGQQEGFLVQDTEHRLVLQAQRIAEMPPPQQHPEQAGGQTGSTTGSSLPTPAPRPGDSESPERPF